MILLRQRLFCMTRPASIGARSESTVKSAIAELAKEGWLTKEERKVGGRNVSNIYRLNVEKLEAAAAAARHINRKEKLARQILTPQRLTRQILMDQLLIKNCRLGGR